MARPLIPPRYVNAPSTLIYSDLPKSIIVTGLRIWGLGWKYDYRKTGLIPLDRLCEILDLSRTQLYEHLARLVATGVLRYTNIDGQFTFLFERGAVIEGDLTGEARAGPSPENRTDGTIDVVDDSSISTRYKNHHEQQQQDTHASRGGCGGSGELSGKPDGVRILDAMGVAEPTRSRLLDLEHVTEEYLSAWRAWFESQDELGVGWVITQMQQGIEPPESQEQSERAERQRYLEWGG